MDQALAQRLPEELQPLVTLAGNLWWSWQPAAAEIFRALHPECWRSSGGNPIKLLREVSPAPLAAAARDAEFVGRVTGLVRALSAELARPTATVGAASSARPIAFFCAEYALHASLAIYSGGLGVLAGDFLKEASDSALPMVAVGLLYRRGYFRQRLDLSGWQHEFWTAATPEDLPIHLERDGDAPRKIGLQLRGRQVAAQIWRADVG